MSDDRVAPTMPEGRRAVLYALRRRGQATADDIARQLDMTVSGARQHLSALVDEGFAEAGELPRPAGQRGRAQLAYTVTDKADGLFPKAYGELTNELLGYASETDASLVDTLFERRRDERIRNATTRLAKCRSLKAKVAELTRILDGDGYLATFEQIGSGVYRVVEHNCAIWAVAQRYGQACSSEIEFIRAVLPEADVERVQHMVAGAPHCAYEVRARARTESPVRRRESVVVVQCGEADACTSMPRSARATTAATRSRRAVRRRRARQRPRAQRRRRARRARREGAHGRGQLSRVRDRDHGVSR